MSFDASASASATATATMEDDSFSSSISKTCAKLKMPTTQVYTNGGGDGGGSSGGGGVGHIVCEYCGKRFSSGKAWGGHKRHHLHMKKKQKVEETLFKKKQRGVIYPGDATMKDGRPMCCLCWKVFPSTESLFGHMRFHPERKSRDDSEVGESGRIDLSSGLVGWLKKDNRGRLSIRDQAAYNLLSLSRHSAATRDTDFFEAVGSSHKRRHRKPTLDLNKPYVSKDGQDGD